MRPDRLEASVNLYSTKHLMVTVMVMAIVTVMVRTTMIPETILPPSTTMLTATKWWRRTGLVLGPGLHPLIGPTTSPTSLPRIRTQDPIIDPLPRIDPKILLQLPVLGSGE